MGANLSARKEMLTRERIELIKFLFIPGSGKANCCLRLPCTLPNSPQQAPTNEYARRGALGDVL